jgi:hypothetical protein
MEAVRRIRDQFYEDTKGMSSDELKAFIAREAESARSELREAVDSSKDKSDDSAG